ncbi:MAG TPA: hypothetical protein VGS97_09690 [Actinocrinis sp.]|uniref:hypothetical protein n=1 Tax=Actinocrinis sp. TaxID=1920516 RepID=UPI002DDD492A|nr:hypothetical protein [Actinocrinis sp.]HEV2344352.1 hypothetical protein [Actinocrinis sp.]
MNEHMLPTRVTVLHYDGDGPAPIERILDASPVESEPEREGWRVLLATARLIRPNATFAELVDLAVSLAPKEGVVTDRRVVEDVALTMMVTAGDGV